MFEVDDSKGGDGIVIGSRTKRKKQGRRKRKKADTIPEFNPEWINAFVVLMLHKIGGTQAVTMKQLKAFDKVPAKEKHPSLTWHEELQAFSITAPEYTLPIIEVVDKPKLII